MEVSYKRQFSQSYMIIKEEENSSNLLELMVLTYNKIAELLPIEMSVADGEVCYWYDISGKQTLADYLSRKQVDSNLLLLLFQSVEKIYGKMQEYLLEEKGIVLEPEYIYMDFEYNNLKFVYLPGRVKDPRNSFQEMMEELLRKLDHSDKQATSIAYEMYQLSLQRELSFWDMLKHAMAIEEKGDDQDPLFREKEFMKKEEEERQEIEKSPWKRVGFSEGEKTAFGWIRKHKFNRIEKQENLPYVTQEDEIVMYPTELLNVSNEIKGVLMYQGVGALEDIIVNKEIFLIGKKQSEVDGFIDRKSISRIHARIRIEEDMYYIEDLNSTNGTYLNGERLEYRQKVMLEPKDRVMFGAEEYIFV